MFHSITPSSTPRMSEQRQILFSFIAAVVLHALIFAALTFMAALSVMSEVVRDAEPAPPATIEMTLVEAPMPLPVVVAKQQKPRFVRTTKEQESASEPEKPTRFESE